MINLLEPYQLNKTLTLQNRIIMAPMTRNKANDDFVPTESMAEYYARRASAGLIVTEGTIIRFDGRGYSNVPGIYTQAQINGWKKVTNKVHANGGKIFAQIWHVGRVSHPHFIGGKLPISASVTKMNGTVKRSENLLYGASREANLNEIQQLIDSFAVAAKNALQAGFDGVEIHGANGYLIDQFLHYHTNHRTDDYGGEIQNMAKFALEVVKACGDAIGYERVGLRLSPGGYLNEITGDVKDALVFQYLLMQLNTLNIAYVHTGNFNDQTTFAELNHATMTAFMRKHYQGNLIACGGYTFETANAAINANQFDLIAFGRPFIANHDLIHLIKNNAPLRAYDAKLLDTLE